MVTPVAIPASMLKACPLACILVRRMVASRQALDGRGPRAGWFFGERAGGDVIASFQRSARVIMNRYESQVFENQHVILDDGVYVNCKFKNCSLEYSGGDVYVQNCQGEGCQLVWRGAAQRTVVLLQGLGLMVPPPLPPGSEPGSRVQ